jgi:DNA-directed RNA polymerase alpha subunit
LKEKYGAGLQGTPEAPYLSALLEHYGVESPQDKHFYNSFDSYDFSLATHNRLVKAEISYMAHLVAMSEADLLRTKIFRRKHINEIKEVLSEFGLFLGMPVQGALAVALEKLKDSEYKTKAQYLP